MEIIWKVVFLLICNLFKRKGSYDRKKRKLLWFKTFSPKGNIAICVMIWDWHAHLCHTWLSVPGISHRLLECHFQLLFTFTIFRYYYADSGRHISDGCLELLVFSCSVCPMTYCDTLRLVVLSFHMCTREYTWLFIFQLPILLWSHPDCVNMDECYSR